MSVKVYLLWFIPEDKREEEESLLIGVYESEVAARAAIERLRSKPGFVDYPKGFEIHSRQLNEDGWVEGFIRD